MTFKVGDRVRYINNSDSLHEDYKAVIGCVGNILRVDSSHHRYPYDVRFDGFSYPSGSHESHPCDAGELELVQDHNGEVS